MGEGWQCLAGALVAWRGAWGEGSDEWDAEEGTDERTVADALTSSTAGAAAPRGTRAGARATHHVPWSISVGTPPPRQNGASHAEARADEEAEGGRALATRAAPAAPPAPSGGAPPSPPLQHGPHAAAEMRAAARALLKDKSVWAEASDGVRVPVSVLMRRRAPADGEEGGAAARVGAAADGARAALLYGYGSYGACAEPAWDPERHMRAREPALAKEGLALLPPELRRVPQPLYRVVCQQKVVEMLVRLIEPAVAPRVIGGAGIIADACARTRAIMAIRLLFDVVLKSEVGEGWYLIP